MLREETPVTPIDEGPARQTKTISEETQTIPADGNGQEVGEMKEAIAPEDQEAARGSRD